MKIPNGRVRQSSYSTLVVKAWFKECGLPEPVFEHRHIEGRKFRLDVAWPRERVGIEVQGGIWIKAAHSTSIGIKRDMEKRNLGLCAGWRVLECEPSDLCTTEMAEMVKLAMAANRQTNRGGNMSAAAVKQKKIKWQRGDSIAVVGVEGRCIYLESAKSEAKNIRFANILKPNGMHDVASESNIKPWS